MNVDDICGLFFSLMIQNSDQSCACWKPSPKFTHTHTRQICRRRTLCKFIVWRMPWRMTYDTVCFYRSVHHRKHFLISVPRVLASYVGMCGIDIKFFISRLLWLKTRSRTRLSYRLIRIFLLGRIDAKCDNNCSSSGRPSNDEKKWIRFDAHATLSVVVTTREHWWLVRLPISNVMIISSFFYGLYASDFAIARYIVIWWYLMVIASTYAPPIPAKKNWKFITFETSQKKQPFRLRLNGVWVWLCGITTKTRAADKTT